MFRVADPAKTNPRVDQANESERKKEHTEEKKNITKYIQRGHQMAGVTSYSDISEKKIHFERKATSNQKQRGESDGYCTCKHNRDY
ncbi:hypothetical protein AVEN_267817-1 [Araneus ventricosus]|uniref:Uncharacterized protein n=1 Tax=Araneus ventricosus TaxID=182803 RepID=A0A4Y2D569_ARAVE|nr:hypothetical protein AVEN_267817-1 [Araneus ventricosus]